MDKNYFTADPNDPIDRVDGKAKVTGTATYAAEYKVPKYVYGFLVGSTIAKGRIKNIDTKSAERAPGVLAVITYRNAPKIPGYHTGKDPANHLLQASPFVYFTTKKYFITTSRLHSL